MIVALENGMEIDEVWEVWPDNGELVVRKDWEDEGVISEKRFEMQDWKAQASGEMF